MKNTDYTDLKSQITQMDKVLRDPLTERIYHNALKIVVKEEELIFETEKEFEIYFNGKKIGKFRCDFVIENKVIVEIKSIANKMPLLFHY